MTLRLAALALALLALTINLAAADEPASPAEPASPTTAPSTTTTPSTTNEKTGSKPATTNVVNGQITKISDKSLTIKYSYRTGGKTKTNPNGKAKTVTKTMTYEIDYVPPVKIVTNGAKPTRTTGSYSDVKVGDTVALATGPHNTKTPDGKSITTTRITGIDVLKRDGGSTPPTTSTSNKNN